MSPLDAINLSVCTRMLCALTWKLSLALLCACASQPAAGKPCTLPIEVALDASARLNPDRDGTPLPTEVRLYQLSALERMEQASFVTLWERAPEALAKDLLSERVLTLFPARSTNVKLELRPEVRFLAAMAVVRQPTGSQWRALLALPDSARMCAAYQESGAPTPAVRFHFDRYRAEASSHLLAEHAPPSLPRDVAPEARP